MDTSVILVQEEPRGPSQNIEVQVTRTGLQKVFFPDVNNLRATQNLGIVVKVIRLITLETLSNGVLSGLANAPVTELQKITLVLYCEGWEKAVYIPVLFLNDMQLPGGTFPHRYSGTRFADWQNIDWTKSFLQYSNTTTSDIGETDGYVVTFDVEYVKIDSQGNVIKGAA